MIVVELAPGPVEVARMEKTLQPAKDLGSRPFHQRTDLRRRQKPVPGDLPEDFEIAKRQLKGSDCLAVPPEAGEPFGWSWHPVILA